MIDTMTIKHRGRLSEHLTQMGHNEAEITALCAQNAIRSQGQSLSHSAELEQGQRLEIHPHYLPVMHRDGILVVNKSTGLASQPTRSGGENLYDQLNMEHEYVALHHRLDRDASGLMLLSTERKLNKDLSKAFQAREIKRFYVAIALGCPKQAQGTWRAPIDGKQACTHYQVISNDEDTSVLLLKLDTGRTHQIRRHAQISKLPLLGDRKYGGAASMLSRRLALHAVALGFIHPANGQRMWHQAPVPRALKQLAQLQEMDLLVRQALNTQQ